MLQHAATHCTTLHHTLHHTLQDTNGSAVFDSCCTTLRTTAHHTTPRRSRQCFLRLIATRCNTLHNTALYTATHRRQCGVRFLYPVFLMRSVEVSGVEVPELPELAASPAPPIHPHPPTISGNGSAADSLGAHAHTETHAHVCGGVASPADDISATCTYARVFAHLRRFGSAHVHTYTYTFTFTLSPLYAHAHLQPPSYILTYPHMYAHSRKHTYYGSSPRLIDMGWLRLVGSVKL